MSFAIRITDLWQPRAGRWLLVFLASFLLAACVPDGVQVPESPLLRQFERTAGLIAYIGTDFNIYTIDQTGENRTAVTEDASPPVGDDPGKIYQFPVWSPQSDRLAFVGVGGPSGSLASVGLYTASPDGTGLMSLDLDIREIPYYLYWSPDGRQISFLSTSASGSSQVLKLMQPDLGEVQIIDTGSPYYWDWSPDGTRLAIHAGGSGGRLSFLTLEPDVIEEGLAFRPSLFQAPAWSPDGSRLLLAIDDGDGSGRLILTDSGGDLLETILRFEGAIAFAWSPDGQKIAYIQSENPLQVGLAGKLSIIHLDQLDEPYTAEQQLVVAFFWSPDSGKIAYFEPVRARTTSEEGAEEGDVQILQRLQIHDLLTAETQAVATYLPTQEFISNLPYFDQYHRSATIWSPDSQSVVISGFASNGAPTIWVVPASGSLPPRFITDGFLAYWSWE